MATTTHWAPNSAASSATSSGRSRAAVLTATLSAPARSRRRPSSALRTPPPTVKGMNTCSAVRATTDDHGLAPVGGRRDVEEGQLVGALGVVAGGQLHRVALVDQVHELHALHHPAAGDVEAGDHPDGAHAATASSSSMRPSSSARPTTTPSSRRPPETASAARARRSSTEETPPEATTGVAVASSTATRPSRSGPDQGAVTVDGRHHQGRQWRAARGRPARRRPSAPSSPASPEAATSDPSSARR